MRKAATVSLIVAIGATCGTPTPAAAQVERWAVDSTPVVDIPGVTADDRLNFEYPTGATRLSDGGLVVSDWWAGMLRFFDGSGILERSVGREGEGPGEFRSITWLDQCAPDSLFAWDPTLDRVTVLDADGRVAWVRRLPADPSVAPPPVTIACNADGVLALLSVRSNQQQRFDMRTGEGPHLEGPLVLVDAEGRLRHDVGDVLLGELRPLGKQTELALGRDRLFVGTNVEPTIDLYTLDGDSLHSLELSVPERAPTPAHYDRAIEAQAMQLPGPDDREPVVEMMRKIPMPERLPFYSGLFADPDGVLWIVLSTPGDSVTRIRAMQDNGEALGEVAIPVGLRVFEVGRDYVLGAYEDERGEPHVAMYRVRRSP